jgi:hypothetical protein
VSHDEQDSFLTILSKVRGVSRKGSPETVRSWSICSSNEQSREMIQIFWMFLRKPFWEKDLCTSATCAGSKAEAVYSYRDDLFRFP